MPALSVAPHHRWKCVQGPFGTADWEYQGHANTNDTTRWHPVCNISAMILACKPLTDALNAAAFSAFVKTGTTFSLSAMRKTCYASLYSMRRTCIPERHDEVLQPVWNWTRLDDRFKVPYTESDLITTRHDTRLHPTIGMHWSAAIAWGDNQLRVCGEFNAGQQLLLKDCAHNTTSACLRWSRCAQFLDPNHESMARNRQVRPCCQLVSDDVCEPCLLVNGSSSAVLWRTAQLFAKLDDGSGMYLPSSCLCADLCWQAHEDTLSVHNLLGLMCCCWSDVMLLQWWSSCAGTTAATWSLRAFVRVTWLPTLLTFTSRMSIVQSIARARATIAYSLSGCLAFECSAARPRRFRAKQSFECIFASWINTRLCILHVGNAVRSCFYSS